MKTRFYFVVLSICVMVALSSCKADLMEVVLYTSDIQNASSDRVIGLPVSATFSIPGRDDEGLLPKSAAISKQYLGDDSEYKISKGDFGDVLVVKCTIPIGKSDALDKYLDDHKRPIAFIIENSTVTLIRTKHFKSFRSDLSSINLMLGLDLPARKTILRFIGDMPEGPTVAAKAVFVDNKAELTFQETVARRESVNIEFRGGSDSVYSEHPIVFDMTFGKETETADAEQAGTAKTEEAETAGSKEAEMAGVEEAEKNPPKEENTTDEYGACLEKAGGVTVDMLNCVADEAQRQDKRLNKVYKQLMGELSDSRKTELRAVQRLWIKYRDANCGFYADPEGGTIETVNSNTCFMEATAARAAELESFLMPK